MSANLEGTQLDTYRLIRRLGGGAFGDVYLGEDLRNAQIAIKVLEPLKTQEAEQHFLREVRSLVRLRHPHIVPIKDFGVDEKTGIPFIVMEYAPNGSLRHHHPGGTPVPLETVVIYVAQIADALQYAHDDELIHCDVKPDNVLIGVNNELLLGDFGIAIFSRTLNVNTSQLPDVIGTPLYMAPEQCQGKPEKASDQYSLAIMTYEWLTGTRPFTGRTRYDVYYQQINVAPRPLSELVPDIPPQVEAVVMIALAKTPAYRYASIKEYAAALTQAYHQVKTKDQWFNEAEEYRIARHHEEAITCYTRAIELDPNFASAYNNRSCVYYDLKQFEQAIADCSCAIALDSNYARAYNNRGIAYDDLNQLEQAIADYSRAIEIDPNFAPAYSNRGFTYNKLKQFEQAIADCTYAIALDPNYGLPHLNRGWAYEQMKQYWQALQDYVRVVELNPKHEAAVSGKERVKKVLNL